MGYMSSDGFSDQFGFPAYDLSPRKVTRFLLAAIALLIFLNFSERAVVYWLNAHNDSQLISIYFNFDEEYNLPSLYSALALGFCSYLLTIIATFEKATKAKFSKHWKALSFIFIFLAVDEACSIHEIFIPVLREAIGAEGILYFTWVIPGFLFVIAFAVAFRKFVFSLPTKIKTLFILAGMLYITGALGMELVGGYIADNFGYSTIYGISSTIEELLEMLGVVVFINGLLSYLQSQLSQLHFTLSFRQPHTKLKNRL